MAQNEPNQADLNVRLIRAVESSPLLYKVNATIEERQVIWQQISEQLNVPEAIVKCRWHILCGYYQRCLEKRRSTDNHENADDGAEKNDFCYEKEMEFMMPYIHARIAIAAANAARKQQEMAAAGSKELSDPEFVITEKDLENATTRISVSDDYLVYDLETLDSETTDGIQSHQYQYHQHSEQDLEEEQELVQEQLMNDSSLQTITEEDEDIQSDQQIHMTEHHIEDDEINEEVIEEIDDCDNAVQNLIMEGGELISEDSDQIVVEEEEVLQMDDQIETVIEEVVEHTPSIDDINATTAHTQENLSLQTFFIKGNCAQRFIRLPTSTTQGHKYAKIMQNITPLESASTSRTLEQHQHQNQEQQLHYEQEEEQKHHKQQEPVVQTSQKFAQEFALMPRRRRAVVLKATPRVQVELTDNMAIAPANSSYSIEAHEAIEETAIDVGAHAVVVGNNSDESNETNATANVTRSHYPTYHHHHSFNERQHERQHKRPHVISHDSSSDQDNRSNDSNAVTTTAADNDEDNTTKGERSEDTIFGELITAMLRHMPPDRKRSIKKSIMDLLLT